MKRLVEESRMPTNEELFDRIEAEARSRLRGHDLQAPHLIDLEVLPVLRREALRGALTSTRADEAAAEALETPFLTADRRLASAPGLRCTVDLFTA